MPDANYKDGDCFRIQFVWRIPEGDFLRAIFEVEVLMRDFISDKYVVILKRFLAGRQEDSNGIMIPLEDVSRNYWALVDELEGRKISLAFEVDDGRPLWLRFETLTGEHNFFSRLNELPSHFDSWSSQEFDQDSD